MTIAEHELIECMASSWDQPGTRPPTDWRIVCSCGHQERGLAGQIEALDAHQRHAKGLV